MIDPWFSFFRIAWVSWTFWLSLLACKKVCIIAFFLALFRIFHLSVKLYCTFVLPNFILGKTNKMCLFYLSSNICSFSTQNINFYIDFFLIRLSKISFAYFRKLVGLDGLEPSTSRLSGARSNHLSYRPFWTHLVSVRPSRRFPDWWRWRESNPWPPACRAGALPAELHPHIGFTLVPDNWITDVCTLHSTHRIPSCASDRECLCAFSFLFSTFELRSYHCAFALCRSRSP